ncbi:retron Ec67 family RNA-directed DNA polymerase/endonuclease [Bradyrhizobium sp. SSUT77]|uniref:retron Ec67 family RNA-directed DNA polymerase/endonuclease n=1 Tax=Bradyrhizobium sp. SSUT77 TaxID=3040603 RepID=UPI00244714DC|nr:retron Ec67 family RNA-directed DNA polymerase/endonuclease [Bradyrhizobium sp. SSUT77]MDH2347259.1 retron Ec67 family RNA-directed DNA polymerase/endonuclease [Bradyrhizobium sp. SSUT77]
MSSLARLKAAKSLDDVAQLLGYQPKGLAYILYKISDTAKYSEFEIPKRAGGVRRIKAPAPKLKALQRRLANFLYVCLAEIEKSGAPRRPLSHGFARSLSIVSNASTHKRRRYVLNLDLRDFFETINFGRVRGILMRDRRFELEPKVATVIAQIACHDNSLPQGSPCSPVLSNIVGHLLDIRLVRLAKQHKCTYSRYADDITFSTSRANFPPELAAQAGAAGEWQLGPLLTSEIQRAGFSIHNEKTRMQVRGSRQLTTGLLVNEKVNIRPEYYRTTRSMCSALFSTGEYYQMIPAAAAGGKASDPDVKLTIQSPASLEGRLGHIYQVRNSVDRRASADKKKNSTATRELYHKFLFYKNFVALQKPLVITEGKTDAIYLKCAIQRLSSFHGKLAATVDGKLKLNISFLNFTSTVHDVLQLGGGTGDFKFFMLRYNELINEFKHAPLLHPVILLIDNDEGAKEVFSVAKGLGVKDISHASMDQFYRIHANLYLIKTPERRGTKPQTCIEDFFERSVLDIEIDGKTFDPGKKHDEDGKYGKSRFAEKVVRPTAPTINFAGFSELLNRMVAVIDDYAARPSTR